jgi:hypothetical protein
MGYIVSSVVSERTRIREKFLIGGGFDYMGCNKKYFWLDIEKYIFLIKDTSKEFVFFTRPTKKDRVSNP